MWTLDSSKYTHVDYSVHMLSTQLVFYSTVYIFVYGVWGDAADEELKMCISCEKRVEHFGESVVGYHYRASGH